MNNAGLAKHYKEKAEELRRMASQDENIQTREALLTVARSYDRLHTKYSGPALTEPETGQRDGS